MSVANRFLVFMKTGVMKNEEPYQGTPDGGRTHPHCIRIRVKNYP